MTDFIPYQNAQAKMRSMVVAGLYNTTEFQEAWATSEAIKNKHGGHPPMYDLDDEQAREMEACESANMRGLR